MCFSQLKDMEGFLYALRDAGSKYSLDRISDFCSALGNPQDDFPKIHVAGTNGKGSVCAMLESILRGSGAKVGMFTSPHLVYIGERVQINRQLLSSDVLVKRVAELKSVADSIFSKSAVASYPSFFEFMTALAFWEFSRAKVDCAVIEVGLGGKLDSTNIISPDISVITSIGLDHIQMLGSSIAEIAREKAGIIKESTPVVCGFLPDEAIVEIEKIAKEKNASLYKVADYYSDEESYPNTSLFGYYQRRNAAIASLCVSVLRERAENNLSPQIYAKLTDEVVKASLNNVSWNARWQSIKLANGARLILDASHNEEGARCLERNLKDLCSDGLRPTVVVGVLGEERAIPLLQVVKKYASKIVLLVPNQPRALNFDALRRCLGETDIPIENGKVAEIFKCGNICTLAKSGDTIISTGSIYLAGEVLAALSGEINDSLQDNPYPAT